MCVTGTDVQQTLDANVCFRANQSCLPACLVTIERVLHFRYLSSALLKAACILRGPEVTTFLLGTYCGRRKQQFFYFQVSQAIG